MQGQCLTSVALFMGSQAGGKALARQAAVALRGHQRQSTHFAAIKHGPSTGRTKFKLYRQAARRLLRHSLSKDRPGYAEPPTGVHVVVHAMRNMPCLTHFRSSRTTLSASWPMPADVIARKGETCFRIRGKTVNCHFKPGDVQVTGHLERQNPGCRRLQIGIINMECRSWPDSAPLLQECDQTPGIHSAHS